MLKKLVAIATIVAGFTSSASAMTCISEVNFRGQEPNLNSYVHKISREDGAEISLYLKGQLSAKNLFLEVIRKGRCIISMDVLNEKQLDDRYQIFASWSELEEGASGDNEGMESDEGEGVAELSKSNSNVDDASNRGASGTKDIDELREAYQIYMYVRACHESRKGSFMAYLDQSQIDRAREAVKVVEERIAKKNHTIKKDVVWKEAQDQAMGDIKLMELGSAEYSQQLKDACTLAFSWLVGKSGVQSVATEKDF